MASRISALKNRQPTKADKNLVFKPKKAFRQTGAPFVFLPTKIHQMFTKIHRLPPNVDRLQGFFHVENWVGKKSEW
jgi:hypothetical protein